MPPPPRQRSEHSHFPNELQTNTAKSVRQNGCLSCTSLLTLSIWSKPIPWTPFLLVGILLESAAAQPPPQDLGRKTPTATKCTAKPRRSQLAYVPILQAKQINHLRIIRSTTLTLRLALHLAELYKKAVHSLLVWSHLWGIGHLSQLLWERRRQP